MGLLINGQWHDQWYKTEDSDGEFIREDAQYRHWITADGSAGPSGEEGFKAEENRYHLYVSLACPWAHRTLIFRQLKQLETMISVSIVHPDMLDQGWSFQRDLNSDGVEIAAGDELYDYQFLHQLYTHCDANYSGRVTVPILWDKQRQCIVNNESSEIIRMFNNAFNHLTGNTEDYYPLNKQQEINKINERIYHTINNGVYRAGFATTQRAYEQALKTLFDTLSDLDKKLEHQRYLVGEHITEADWRLFTTLVRFDAVYVGHFKCNWQRIADYQHLSAYLRELYQYQNIKQTVNFDHIKRHYYYSHTMINPTGIVPIGPELRLDEPHGRS